MKKVSIIMPNYNHARYLPERLESLWAQDYTDIEVILLDDASTDGSDEILRTYAQRKQVKVLLFNAQNSGNTFTQWQRGLEAATGEYVWIAESDDVAAPTFLSTTISALEREEAVLAFCQNRWIDEQGNDMHRHYDRRWNRDFSMDGIAFIKRFLLGYSYICNASGVVFKRSAAMQIDMHEIQPFHASGDRLFWIRMAQQGRVAYVAQPLNSFRQHTQKVSGPAENQGLNIVQDHAIYQLVSPALNLTNHEKRIICGYHWQAMHRPSVSPQGEQNAMAAWRQEPQFGYSAYIEYLMQRAIEKC